MINVGNLTNKGMEINLRLEVIKAKDFMWEIGGNITKVKNELTNVFEKEVPVLGGSTTSNVESYPVNSWFGYKFSHVNPETGSLIVLAQKRSSKLVGGKVETTFTDAEVDLSKISVADLQAQYRPYYLGHSDPEIYGGFNTRVTYKTIELTANFVYADGNDIISFRDRREGPSGATNDIVASRTNRLKDNLYRWRQAGDVRDILIYRTANTSYTNYLISTDIESGAYLKCTELALSWRAPRQVLNNTVLKTLKATLVASNLLALSPYSGTDAETKTPFGYPNTRATPFH